MDMNKIRQNCAPTVEILIPQMEEKLKEVTDLRKQWDAEAGTVSKKQVQDEFASNVAVPDNLVETLSGAIRNHAGDNAQDVAGFLYQLFEKMEQEFPEAQKAVADEVSRQKEAKKDQPETPQEVKNQIRETHNEALKQYRAMVNLMVQMSGGALSDEDFEDPDAIRGSKGGKRGPRLNAKYKFFIGNNLVGEELTTVAGLSDMEVAELKEVIAEQNPNFDFANPPDRFTVNLGEHGQVVAVRQLSDEASSESASDDDDEDDED